MYLKTKAFVKRLKCRAMNRLNTLYIYLDFSCMYYALKMFCNDGAVKIAININAGMCTRHIAYNAYCKPLYMFIFTFNSFKIFVFKK